MQTVLHNVSSSIQGSIATTFAPRRVGECLRLLGIKEVALLLCLIDQLRAHIVPRGSRARIRIQRGAPANFRCAACETRADTSAGPLMSNLTVAGRSKQLKVGSVTLCAASNRCFPSLQVSMASARLDASLSLIKGFERMMVTTMCCQQTSSSVNDVAMSL